MVELIRLTKPRILRQVGEASVHKAKAYLHRNVWCDLRIQGNVIKGRCQGQAPNPYRVEVEFENDAIARADCSCPVGSGGHCKHVAALLLYYREHPDAFVEVEELEAALERRSKPELIAIIRRMIRRAPELELVLEAPIPGYTGGPATEDPEPYRRQVRAAFEHAGQGWGSASIAAHELADIVATGDEFRAANAIAAACVVYRAVAEEVLGHVELAHDEEGDLINVIAECARRLCDCLDATDHAAPHRESLLRTLVDLYVADEAHGGLGMSDTIPEALQHQTSPDERRRIAAWLRESLPQGNEWRDVYQRRSIGAFLLEIEADELDDEAYLRLCRETGRAVELVDRLLRLGRVAEALKALKAADDHDLLPLADVLVQHGHAQEAEWHVENRAGQVHRVHLLEWLKRRATERNDKPAALKLAEQAFRRSPSFEQYEELKKLAGKGWPELRQRLVKELEKNGLDWLLIDIHLRENEVGEALALLKSDWSRVSHRSLDVAKAAEKDYPAEAKAIYLQAAESLIGQRHRDAYKSACRYLKKVRELSKRCRENGAWKEYIDELRDRHKLLRAFLSELNDAGL